MRPYFRGETVGIGLLYRIVGDARGDGVLVQSALADVGNEAFPDARRTHRAHRMGARSPAVEIADNGDFTRVGRPHGEVSAGNAVLLREMGAELFVGAIVRSFRP